MLAKMEHQLGIPPSQIRLRVDGGFGTDDNINHALSKGYQLLAKMHSGNRAKLLAESVNQWESCPNSLSDQQPRQAEWVTAGHIYSHPTRQIALRTKYPKQSDEYRFCVLVTTDFHSERLLSFGMIKAFLHTIIADYDQRAGQPESSFCQDNQGLSTPKRNKRKFVAQQMLVLLNQLAHNLIQWLKHWLMGALDAQTQLEWTAQQMLAHHWWETDTQSPQPLRLARTHIESRGLKRFVREIFSLHGQIRFKRGQVDKLILNPLYPQVHRLVSALNLLLAQCNVTAELGHT